MVALRAARFAVLAGRFAVLVGRFAGAGAGAELVRVAVDVTSRRWGRLVARGSGVPASATVRARGW